MQATWFNNKYIKNSIHKGETYIFYGKVRRIGPRKTMENPIFERPDKPQVVTGKIVPLYPLTEGLTQKIVQTAMTQALDAAAELSDPLPAPCLRATRLSRCGRRSRISISLRILKRLSRRGVGSCLRSF